MRALIVARKNLVEMWREWQLLLLVVLLPLSFLVITALGYSMPLLSTYRLLLEADGAASAGLIDALIDARYGSGQPIFELEQVTGSGTIDRIDAVLRDQQATALVRLAPGGDVVTIRGDALNPRFYGAATHVERVLSQAADRAAGQPEVVRILEEPLGGIAPQTEFDLYAPGMIIFALLLIVPQTAMLLAREIRWGTLQRLRLTRLRAVDLLGGASLAQMVVAVAQVIVVLSSAKILGFTGNSAWGLALVVGLVVSFSAIGQGLLVACFVENDSQAINVGSAVAMIQVFLSGAFYQLPPITILHVAGHAIDLFDVFAATHGFVALQQVLSFGAGLGGIAFRLGAALALSMGYFVLGVWMFQRQQMRQAKGS